MYYERGRVHAMLIIDTKSQYYNNAIYSISASTIRGWQDRAVKLPYFVFGRYWDPSESTQAIISTKSITKLEIEHLTIASLPEMTSWGIT